MTTPQTVRPLIASWAIAILATEWLLIQWDARVTACLALFVALVAVETRSFRAPSPASPFDPPNRPVHPQLCAPPPPKPPPPHRPAAIPEWARTTPVRIDRTAFEEAESAGLPPCVIVVQVADIKPIRDQYGKQFRNAIHARFGHGLGAVLPGMSWRLYQYEHAAAADSEAAAHAAMAHLAAWLEARPMTVWGPYGQRIELTIGFVYGLGSTFDEGWKGVVTSLHNDPLSARPVLTLPDGCRHLNDLEPRTRFPLEHPDAETRALRRAHRRLTDGAPTGVQVQDPETGRWETITQSEAANLFRLSPDAAPRWVVPWKVREHPPIM